MFKLVVSDFDGTLLDSDDAIAVSTVAALDEYRRNGNLFAIATGRVLPSVLEYISDYPFIDYILGLDGSYIYDVANEKAIFKQRLSLKAIRTIHEKYANENLIYYCTPDKWNLYAGFLDYPDYSYVYEDRIISFDKFLEKNKTNIYKIEVHFNTLEEAKKAAKEISKMNIEATGVVQVHTKLNYLVEITSSKINKYISVQKLQEKLKLKTSEIAVIGDGYNDLELVGGKYYGVAVKNACPEILKKAKYITNSNNNKGVERFLREKCLNKEEMK